MKISIIIPIYNCEEYICRNIESLLCQTFTDFELILVNDGSTDSSGSLCDEYALKDERIRVIHKENGGAASARNRGLDIARGEYVAFIDSDDYVEKDYLLRMYAEARQNDADVVVCCIDWIIGTSVSAQKINANRTYSFEEYVCAVTNGEVDYITAFGPCGKLIKKSVIDAVGLRFPERYKLSEDRIFNLCLMRHLKTVVTSDYIGYHYDNNNVASLTHNRRSYDTLLNIIEAEICVWKEYKTTLDAAQLLKERNKWYLQSKLNAFLAMDKLISVSVCTGAQKVTLYKALLGIITSDELEELNKSGAFKLLVLALRLNNLTLIRLWLFAMRMKQKLK